MCQFLSCIIDKKGRVYYDIIVDSHEHIIDKFKLDAVNDEIKNYVRIEIIPIDGDVFNHDIKNWKIKIDEQQVPVWFERQQKTLYEKNIYNVLKDCFKNCFLFNQKDVVLSDGVYFVKDSIISKLEKNVIIRILSSSTVSKMYDSSTVSKMYDSSTVSAMYDSSTVQEMRVSSKVQEMFGSSTVSKMYDSSTVSAMYDSSTVITHYKYWNGKHPKSKKDDSIFIDRKNRSILVGKKKIKF